MSENNENLNSDLPESRAEAGEIQYVDPDTGILHTFKSTAEKMQWEEDKHNRDNK